MYHETANGKTLRRTYQELSDRARGFAYYLKEHGFKRVGILCPNTPAFLEAMYGIAGASAVSVGEQQSLLSALSADVDLTRHQSQAEARRPDLHLYARGRRCHPRRCGIRSLA